MLGFADPRERAAKGISNLLAPVRDVRDGSKAQTTITFRATWLSSSRWLGQSKEVMMAEDPRAANGDASKRTSPATKTFGYGTILLLLLAIVLLATGAVKFGPF